MSSKKATEKESITTTLAKFAHRLAYTDIPEGIRELAKTRILDTLSCSYAGHHLPYSQTAIKIAENSLGDSTVYGGKIKVSLLDAIMANCVLAHSILQEDRAFLGHPSTMIVPAALAIGEQERASGKETIISIILGYEFMGRISRGVYPMAISAFRPGPIMGTFGVAATVGRLLRLDVSKLTHALGYAATLAPGLPSEGWWRGTMEPIFEAGICARIGTLSAILAQGGATVSPEVIEGRHGFLYCWAGTRDRMNLITEGLGNRFVMSETVAKPYPACGANQLPIKIVMPLAELGLKSGDIARIVEKVSPGGASYAGSNFAGPFVNQLQAQMSMQFCAAATILGRPVDSFTFYSDHYDDPEVAELAKKVELVSEEGRTQPGFELYTHDGRSFTSEAETAEQFSDTTTREKMEHKFKTLAIDFLGEKRMQQIIELVMNLENVGDVSTVTKIL